MLGMVISRFSVRLKRAALRDEPFSMISGEIPKCHQITSDGRLNFLVPINFNGINAMTHFNVINVYWIIVPVLECGSGGIDLDRGEVLFYTSHLVGVESGSSRHWREISLIFFYTRHLVIREAGSSDGTCSKYDRPAALDCGGPIVGA